MKRRSLILVMVLAAFLLSACAGIGITYKNAPEVSAPGVTLPPSDNMEAPADSNPAPSSVSADPEGTPPDTAGTSAPSASADVEQAAPAPASSAEPSPAASTAPTPENSPSPVPSGTSEQPPLLSRLAGELGLSLDDIAGSQLVLVAAAGSKADIYCYDKDDNGLWKLNTDIGTIKGYVGRNGVSFDKREGDGCTPGGLYGLSFAFGNSAKPVTGLSWRDVTENSYWVDDPDSLYYNQWVEGTDNADWTSAEHLSESPKNYAYAVVVDYNMAPNTVAGKGSAIFLHCKTESTAGCVAASQGSILNILKWLSQDKNPQILITTA